MEETKILEYILTVVFSHSLFSLVESVSLMSLSWAERYPYWSEFLNLGFVKI